MLTEKETKLISKIYFQISKTGFFPFTWNGEVFVEKVSRQKRIGNFCLVLYHFWSLCYLGWQVPQEETLWNIMQIFIRILCILSTLSAKYVIYFTDYVVLMNQLFIANNTFALKYFGDKFSTKKLREMVFGLACVSILGTFLGIYILSLDFGFGRMNSVLEIILELILVILRSIGFLDLALTALTVLISIYATYTVINFWTYTVCIAWPKSGGNGIRACLYVYQILFMLKQLTNKVFETSVVPLGKLIVITAMIPCSYVLIRHRHQLDLISFLFISVMCFTIPLLLCPMAIIMSNTYNYSVQLQKNVLPCVPGLHYGEKKQILTRLKSCQLLRCQIGVFYYMEGKAKLTLIEALVQGVAFALLTL